MVIHDLTSRDTQGANGNPRLDKPRHSNITGGDRDSGRLNLEIVSLRFRQSLKRIESHDMNVYLPHGGLPNWVCPKLQGRGGGGCNSTIFCLRVYLDRRNGSPSGQQK